MNIRYTKEWAEPNTKHYESLFRKIKDSVDELEGIFVQRNEMIKYIEELHNLLQGLPLFPYMDIEIMPLNRHPSSVRSDDS